MWQALNQALGQALETVSLEPIAPQALLRAEQLDNGAHAICTYRLNGNAFEVVAQVEDGDTFYDIFDVMSGQCINEGEPLYELPPPQFSQWPTHLANMVVDFYASAPTANTRL